MSLWDLTDKSETVKTLTPYNGKTSSFFTDVIPASFDFTRDNVNANASDRLFQESYQESRKKLEDLEGVAFDPKNSPSYDPSKYQENQTISPRMNFKNGYLDSQLERRDFFRYVEVKRKENPELYKDILTEEEAREVARQKALESAIKFQEVTSRATPLSGLAGGIIGGIGASFTDPVNLATMSIGAGAASGLLKTIAVEAAIGAATEAVSQPAVAKWQVELGQKYDLGDFAENVALGGVFGGIFGSLGKTLRVTTDMALGAMANNPRIKKSLRYGLKALERFEHINNANPFITKVGRGAKRHLNALQKTMDALESKKIPKPEDIEVKQSEFDLIDTRANLKDSIAESNLKEEIAKFQDEPLTPDQIDFRESLILDELEVMKQELIEARKGGKQVVQKLNKANNEGYIKTEVFYEKSTFPEWFREKNIKKRDAGLKAIDRKRGPVYERMREAAIERLEEGYESPVVGQVMPNEDFIKASTPPSKIKEVDTSFDFGENKQNNFGLDEGETVSLRRHQEMIEDLESDTRLKADEQNFQRELEDDADFEIYDEVIQPDGSTATIKKSIKQLMDELPGEQRMVTAITNCGIG